MIKDIEYKFVSKKGPTRIRTKKINGFLESLMVESPDLITGQLKVFLRSVQIIYIKTLKQGIFPIRVQSMWPDANSLFSYNSTRIALNDELEIEYSAKPKERIKLTIRYDG